MVDASGVAGPQKREAVRLGRRQAERDRRLPTESAVAEGGRAQREQHAIRGNVTR